MSQYLLRLSLNFWSVDEKIKEKSANDYIKRFGESNSGVGDGTQAFVNSIVKLLFKSRWMKRTRCWTVFDFWFMPICICQKNAFLSIDRTVFERSPSFGRTIVSPEKNISQNPFHILNVNLRENLVIR